MCTHIYTHYTFSHIHIYVYSCESCNKYISLFLFNAVHNKYDMSLTCKAFSPKSNLSFSSTLDYDMSLKYDMSLTCSVTSTTCL